MPHARVKSWSDDEGWGVLVSDDLDGDIFAHFGAVEGPGCRTLAKGDKVTIDWQQPGQDGCAFRATRVVRAAP
jgi:CspA family cold shock protein